MRPFQEIDKDEETRFLKEWEQPFVWDSVTIEWLNSRPKEVIEMMLRFPIDAKVKSTRPLDCPKPHEIGIVVSYLENGLVYVAVPGRPLKAQCQQDWIEIVEYRKGLSPDDIRKHLEEQHGS